MCIAFPGKIVEINENNFATIDINGIKKEISLDLLNNVDIGDYVIAHAGFAIQKVEKTEAKERLNLLDDIINQVYNNE